MADEDFTLGKAMQIAHNCSNNIGGKSHILDPSATLSDYGIITSEKLSSLRKDIRVNPKVGLLSYHRTIDPNALKDVDSGWILAELRRVIFKESFPLDLPIALNADTNEWNLDTSNWISPKIGQNKAPGTDNSKQKAIKAGAAGVIIGLIAGSVLKRR